MGIISGRAREIDPAQVALERLDRAQGFYDDLGRLWREYRRRAQYSIEMRPWVLLGRVDAVWHCSELPGEAMATAARGAFAEARSALDNFAYGLVKAAGGSEADLGAAQLPVVRRRRNWAKEAERLLPGVGGASLARVADTQPFSHPRYGDVPHPFELLSRVHNSDKHHTPLELGVMPFYPPWSKVGAGSLQATFPREIAQHAAEAFGSGAPDEMVDLNVGPFEDGSVLMSFKMPPGSTDTRVEVELPPLSLMAYLSGVPVLSPILDPLANAIAYSRSAVQYMTGHSAELAEALPKERVPRKPSKR